ncbi:transposase [Tichowtungia aerotolerans]|uniref:Transposase n=1 Tax=Tichowtungia aerotolerans TaxID=2697043 RepID=A0A6P1MHX7_9BACT|nr:transposase [Tichowtungia aerotolerans]QHI70655.1 transposase [Tichowtungia aerotolerans]
MNKQRRKHTAEFKARVALEAIKGLETINQIAAKYELHPVQVGAWKKELLEGAGSLFVRKNAKDDLGQNHRIEELERKVGQLTMGNEFLEKKSVQLGIAVKGRRW